MRVVVPALAVLLAACSGQGPAEGTALQPHQAELQVRDITIRANLVPTRNLAPEMASGYGIERGDNVVMLMVGVRTGGDGQHVSVPARVTASTVDLRGNRAQLPLRELEAGGFTDHVGTFRVEPPETLTFEVEVRRDGEPPATLRFNHDF